jgi:hypothetical protein
MNMMRYLNCAIGGLMVLSSVAGAADAARPVEWKGGTELMVFGAGDLAATNAYLAAEGLEAIPVNGASVMAVVPGVYPDSNYGSFSMTVGGILARPIGSDSADQNWFFFGLTTSDSRLERAQREVWGADVRSGTTAIALAGTSGMVSVRSEDRAVLNLAMAPAPSQMAPAAFAFDVFSPVRGPKRSVYHHACSGTAYDRPFDPATDTFRTDPASALGRVLTATRFVPQAWSLYFTEYGVYELPRP